MVPSWQQLLETCSEVPVEAVHREVPLTSKPAKQKLVAGGAAGYHVLQELSAKESAHCTGAGFWRYNCPLQELQTLGSKEAIHAMGIC